MSSHQSTDFLKAHRHGGFGHYRGPVAPWLRMMGWTVIFMFILTVPLLYSGIRLAYAGAAGKAELESAQFAAERLDFKSAGRHAGLAHDHFVDARERVQSLRFLKFVPGVAPSYGAAEALISSGIAATDAAAELFIVADEVLATVGKVRGLSPGDLPLPDPKTLLKDLTTDEKRQILAAVATEASRLKTASAALDEAVTALDGIPTVGIAPGISAAVSPVREKLTLARGGLGVVAPFADVLPSLLGYPDAQHYLFFFANNDELRPGGGFLGVYGAATVKDATLTELKTDDVYALDGPSEKTKRPAAPAPLQKYTGVKQWYLRDANWSPDFPTSARLMAQFYREEASVVAGYDVPAPDMVITITPDLAEDIVRLIGPVTAGGITFTADNLIEKLQYEVEMAFARKGIAYEQRKDIVGALVQAVTSKLLALPVSELVAAAGIVERNLEEGHVMLYSTDAVLQKELEARDWAAKMKPVTGDYVSWIDANLAALKTDQAIERRLSYVIEPEAGSESFIGKVSMTYENKGTFTWKTTRYRTYARVYLPGATEFLGVDGAMENDKLKDPARRPGSADGYDQLGRRAFGAFVSVEPGETRTLTFRFRLGPQVVAAIRDGIYHLDVEKQLGTGAVPLTLDLDVGKKLQSAEPSENRKEFGDSRYRLETDLRVDRAFDLKF